MGIEPNAEKTLGVAWEYWGWTHTGLPMGMYGLDERRARCHDRLCRAYGISKEKSREVTDHLDKYENAVQMHEALLVLKKE